MVNDFLGGAARAGVRAWPGGRPLVHLEPVRSLERGHDVGVGVGGVDDVVVDVAADLDVVERHRPRDPRDDLERQVRVVHGHVLELEIGRELHQRGPVRAGLVAHRAGPFDAARHVPASRTSPRLSPSG